MQSHVKQLEVRLPSSFDSERGSIDKGRRLAVEG